MALTFSKLIKLKNWRAASALSMAMWAYERGRYPAALKRWERIIQCERKRTSDYMAFYAVLMAANKRPAEEGLAMFRRVAAGEFRRNDPAARYAEALAHYWVAFLTGGPDVVQQWLNAHKLQPRNGWVARWLTLPKNPVDPAGRWSRSPQSQ